MRRRSTHRAAPVDHVPMNYAPVGGTKAPDLLRRAPRGYRSSEHRGRLGSGDQCFERAAASLRAWGVQRGAGLGVTGDGTASGTAPDVAPGVDVVLRLPAGPFAVRAPARIVYVIDEPDRVGFAYGTLRGNPISGEESFVVERSGSGEVRLVLREFSRPSTAFWRLGAPALRIAQRRMAKRYLRALLPDAHG